MAGTGRSVTAGQSHFANVPGTSIERSKFNRSSGLKTTFDAGLLVPIYLDEALPGDTFNMSATLFGRLSTPLKPVLDNMFLETFFFAVPNRLVWDNWQKFNGEQTNPGDSTDFLIPRLLAPASGGYLEESLFDYMGIPTKVDGMIVNALHMRAYNLIYNEFFRDENLQNSLTVPTDDGPDGTSQYALRRRGKRHDYFTSCLPWPEKGGETTAFSDRVRVISDNQAPPIKMTAGALTNVNLQADQTTGNLHLLGDPGAGGPHSVEFGQQSGLKVNEDLMLITQIREAFQIQRLKERDARGGTRYTEIVRSHFGVVSSDQRLQRPEYLGGGSTRIQINTVQQTSETNNTPQGNLAAFGVIQSSGHNFVKSFTEHCVILGIACVRADLNYQQGLDRMWDRQTRFDYYWPALAHIGEQTVLNRELYAQGPAEPGDPDSDPFGYQERYGEYRYKPSKVTAAFRSNHTTPLDTWHLAQDFSALPVLNASFIEENPPIDRIVAVPSEPHILLDCYFDLTCARPIPTYGVPGMADHF